MPYPPSNPTALILSSAASPSATSLARSPHRFQRLTIEGGNHFPSLSIDLSPGLNCFIGSTGAGKTTILQSLRHAIGMPATDPRAEKNEAQVLATLGAGSLVAHVASQHGAVYRSERRANEAPLIKTADGVHAPVTLYGELFSLDFYAQNQLQGMAEDPAAQLALIDKFGAAEIAALEARIDGLAKSILAGADEATRLQAEIEDLTERASELPTIAAALKALSDAAGPNAEEARRADEAKVLRGREQAMLRGLRDDLRAVLAGAGSFEVDARRRLGGEMAAPLLASANRATLDHAHAGARAALHVIQEAVTQVRGALAAAESAVTGAGDVLGAAHAGQEAAYDALSRKHDADRGRIAERDRLQRRFLDLEALERKLTERRREHATRSAELAVLRDERVRCVETLFAVRSRLAKEITTKLEAYVDVAIVGGGNHDAYLALLIDICKGSGARAELLADIARNIRPEDLTALVRADDTAPIEAVDEMKTRKSERAQKLIDTLRASPRLAEIDVVRLTDVPVIRLLVDKEYVLSSELSFGQRCMAIFPIVLILSAAPLVIDQPEDQLDNAFIFEVLVPTLLIAKRSRQIIFATHNPNIVVLAESDRVFVVEGTRVAGQVVHVGTVDEVRGPIEKVVEGGREAFLRRSERYGHTLPPPPAPREP